MHISKFFLTLILITTAYSARVPLDDIIRRANNRNFPSLFQTWGPMVDTTGTLSEYELVAKHDLLFHGAWYFGLKWDSPDGYEGNAAGFTAESIEEGLKRRAELLNLNPNLIIIGEVRHYDAKLDYLPEDSPYWMRDDSGNIMENTIVRGGYYRLDHHDSAFQQFVGNQCREMLESGVVDGCILDWANDSRYEMIKVVREVIGDSAVLMGNTNTAISPKITPLLNAVFMESSPNWQQNFWDQLPKAIDHYWKNIREPKLICLELWPEEDHPQRPLQQYNHMRAGLTALLTHSNGYFVYYPEHDLYHHKHYMYPIWESNLGKPVGERKQQNGAWIREFEYGSVAYNPPGNKHVVFNFNPEHLNFSTDEWAASHTVQAYDGAVFLKEIVPDTISASLPDRSEISSNPLPRLQYVPELNRIILTVQERYGRALQYNPRGQKMGR